MKQQTLLILLLLLVLSLTLAELCRGLLGNLHPLLSIGLNLLFFALIFYLFDRYLWRYFGLATPTNFHGEWEGRLNTSRTESSEVEIIRVRIYQHWLSSRVDFFAPHSSSTSLAAVFYTDKQGQNALAYIYWSKPHRGKETIVPQHVGLNIFYPVEADKLSGYFHHLEAEAQGVKITHGQVVLTRVRD